MTTGGSDSVFRRRRNATIFPGRVGEWLKPADCKSAAPCGLRRFESSPVHQYAFGVQRQLAVAGNSRGNGVSDLGAAAQFLKGRGFAWVAQLVERVLGKDEVTGSIPVPGSRTGNYVGVKFGANGAGVTQR